MKLFNFEKDFLFYIIIMKYTKLTKMNSNYFLDCSNCHQTDILYHFLTDNYKTDSTYIKNTIINNDDRNSLSGNLIEVFYSKLKNEYILEDIFYQGDNSEENKIVIIKDDFLYLLNKWEALLKQNPDQIIITQNEDTTFTLTGKFADGREI